MSGASLGTQGSNIVVEGLISISHSLARVLFDAGATHSLISSSFAGASGLRPESLEVPLYLNSPIGGMKIFSVCRSCVITIGGEKF